MLTYWETLIATQSNIAVSDSYAALWGKRAQNNYTVATYTGTLPATLRTVAGYLESYKIYGSTVQDGTPTPENPIMPSGCGERTENLFDKDATLDGYWLSSTTGKVVSQNGYSVSDYIRTSDGESYTLVEAGRTFCWYDENKRFIGTTASTTASAPTGAAYFRVNLYTAKKRIAMVIEGSTALPYEPYGYKLPILSNSTVTNIYIGDTPLEKDEYVDSESGKIYRWAGITGLSEPLCGIGTYTDSLDLSTGVVTRRIKKVVLTGEEGWRRTANKKCYYIDLANGCPGDYLKQLTTTSICSHYQSQNNTASGSNAVDSGHFCFYIGGGFELYIGETTISSATDFKSYLAAQYANGTPVTVWYVLAEPETSTIPVPSGLTGVIEGYLIQDGTPTPEAPIYPTANGVKQADGTYSIENVYLDPTDPPVPLPQIPTVAGTTVIDYNGAPKPEKVEFKYKVKR